MAISSIAHYSPSAAIKMAADETDPQCVKKMPYSGTSTLAYLHA